MPSDQAIQAELERLSLSLDIKLSIDVSEHPKDKNNKVWNLRAELPTGKKIKLTHELMSKAQFYRMLRCCNNILDFGNDHNRTLEPCDPYQLTDTAWFKENMERMKTEV